MKLSEIKHILSTADAVTFKLQDGTFVPEHFHVTEVGIIDKHFIDCGGTIRTERMASFQLWNADDSEHRLKPGKLLNIIGLSERLLGMEDLEIEVEYQSNTIGKYDLGFNSKHFTLIPKQTACLAKEGCGLPPELLKTEDTMCCTPGGTCC